MGAKLSQDERERLFKPEVMLTYVDHRLDVWARWFARGNGVGLGYPPCSLEYRVLREGKSTSTPRPLPVNTPAEEMEAIVVKLAQQRPLLAQALRDYYFRGGSLRVLARDKGMSASQLQWRVEQGRHWIAGWFTADLENRLKQNAQQFAKNF